MNNIDKQRQRFLTDNFGITPDCNQYVIALAGNPNVGKSTIFNALTGLHQHTGNWPGKTVDNAQGTFSYQDQSFLLVDLPGTYSILAHSAEEEVARNFLCFGEPDVVIIVLDASCLERNLNLALQILEITSRVIICVNLLDEAKHKGISIDLKALTKELGVPVIGTTARTGDGIGKLKDAIIDLVNGTTSLNPLHIKYSPAIEADIASVITKLTQLSISHQKKRWLALRLLENEENILSSIQAEAFKWIKK